MSKLALKNIRKNYGPVAVVDDLSLDLHQGELVTLLGPSGCGKTTTLRMIAGFIELTAGAIEVDGQPISTAQRTVAPEHRGMSMIFQSYAIWPNMTVAENVGFGLNVRRTPAKEAQQRVHEMLELVHLAPLAQRYPAELSGGQQQRVAICRALVQEPEILLADEPTASLDPRNIRIVMDALQRLNKHFGITIVVNLHSLDLARAYCDRLVGMAAGKVVFDDVPEALTDATARDLYGLEAGDVLDSDAAETPEGAVAAAA